MIHLRHRLLLIPLCSLILLSGCGSGTSGSVADETTTNAETTEETTTETTAETGPSPSGENTTVETELPVPSISLSEIYDPEVCPEDAIISGDASSGDSGGSDNEIDLYVFVIEKEIG